MPTHLVIELVQKKYGVCVCVCVYLWCDVCVCTFVITYSKPETFTEKISGENFAV